MKYKNLVPDNWIRILFAPDERKKMMMKDGKQFKVKEQRKEATGFSFVLTHVRE